MAAKKVQANAAIDALKKAVDFDLYEEDAIATINGLYATAKSAIEAATTEAEVEAAVAAFETALANVPQKGGDIDDSSSSADVSDSDTTNTDDQVAVTGCFGSASGLAGGMMLLGAATVALFKKKEN